MTSQKEKQSKTTVIEPAPLSVRFSAGILDIGFVILFIAGISLVWRMINDVPMDRMGYVPPSSKDALPRLAKSAAFFVALSIYYAAWISSKLQATPGMLPVNTHVHKGNGDRIGFVRAMCWFMTAFLPIFLCNVIILLGLHFNESLLHLGQLNMFSFLVLLQVIWFLFIISGDDKRAVHDIICGVRVDHTTRPFSHPILKHIAFLPLSGVAVVVMSFTLILASVNLFDAKLDKRIETFSFIIPEDNRNLLASWRNDSDFRIEGDAIDFSCGAHEQRFFRRTNCPERDYINAQIDKNQALIDQYWDDFRILTSRSERLRIYVLQESIKLTDLVLADFLYQFSDADEDERENMFDQWLELSLKWDDILREPDYQHVKSAVSIQYNHVLNALTIMLDIEPDLINRTPEKLDNLLKPVRYDASFITNIIAYQYAHFNGALRHSRIDYFPFIQPDFIRNQFLRQTEDIEKKFASIQDIDNPLTERRDQFFDEQPGDNLLLALFKLIYNPLGRQIYESVVGSSRGLGISIADYERNNSMKRMLRVALLIKRGDIPQDQIQNFIQTLPDELKFPQNGHELHYNERGKYLYHFPTNIPNIRRILPI